MYRYGMTFDEKNAEFKRLNAEWVGKTIGKIKILDIYLDSIDGKSKSKILCLHCNTEHIRTFTHTKSGNTKSCGCQRYKYEKKLTRFENLSGKIYGKLTVLEHDLSSSKYGDPAWKCKCECGKFHIAKSSILRKGKCLSCGCNRYHSGKDNYHWVGYEEIPGLYWNSTKDNAARRNLSFNITIEYAWDLFLKQNRKCALSCMELKLNPKRKRTASIDRIDSSQGYETDNIQWVHKDINKMKSNFKDQYFIELCRKVADCERNIPVLLST